MPPICKCHGKGQMTPRGVHSPQPPPCSRQLRQMRTHTLTHVSPAKLVPEPSPVPPQPPGLGRPEGGPEGEPGEPQPWAAVGAGPGAGLCSRRAGGGPGPAADLLRQQITALVYIGCRRLPSGPAPPGCLHNPEHRRPRSASNRSIALAPAPDNTSGPGEPRHRGPNRPPATWPQATPPPSRPGCKRHEKAEPWPGAPGSVRPPPFPCLGISQLHPRTLSGAGDARCMHTCRRLQLREAGSAPWPRARHPGTSRCLSLSSPEL